MQHVTSTENIQGYVLWPIVDAGWCELALSLRTTARSLPLHTTRSRVSRLELELGHIGAAALARLRLPHVLRSCGKFCAWQDLTGL